jgi:protein-S-isoprenylcysteine O-methyltransferase Ste14
MNFNTKVWLSLAALGVIMGAFLFVPAGTVYYWQAWVFLTIYIGGSIPITLYLMRHDPALLERRMKGGPTAEKQPVQRLIMWGVSIGFIALLVVPALDFRFGWSAVSLGGIVTGNVLVLTGLYFIFLVYRENTFASATIEVAKDQQVITTGPYAVVRHPMYASALIYLFGIPLALGSYWGLVVLGVIIPSLIWRLFDEERFLAKNLTGYTEYQQRVKYRLVPFVW